MKTKKREGTFGKKKEVRFMNDKEGGGYKTKAQFSRGKGGGSFKGRLYEPMIPC